MNDERGNRLTVAMERISMVLGALYAGHMGDLDQKLKAVRLSRCGFSNTEIADLLGKVSRTPLQPVAQLDPADIADKVCKYTGSTELELEIRRVRKRKRELVVFVMQGVSIPIVFKKPGTYDIGAGKQRTAFSVGT